MPSVRDFYDGLAAGYHLIFPDWNGTQAIGLAAVGHGVIGSDLSPVAAARAAAEAGARGLRLTTAAADMRALPFRASAFDVVVCADNSLAHLLTADDVGEALAGMRRVLRDDGLLMIGIRDYTRTASAVTRSTSSSCPWATAGRCEYAESPPGP